MGLRIGPYRRPLAALFAAAGTGFALLALQPDSAPGEKILVASRDLPSGTTLRHGDLRTVSVPSAAVPAGALHDLEQGRVLAGPMRRGEPLTDVRVISSTLLKGYGQGTVATPVRIADATSVQIVHPGDRVDILAPPTTDELVGPLPLQASPNGPPDSPTTGARLIVTSVPVVAVPRPRPGTQGALVVLATSRSQAAALAGAGPRLALTITTA
jgi:Flp pilus assembly protein CpaB